MDQAEAAAWRTWQAKPRRVRYGKLPKAPEKGDVEVLYAKLHEDLFQSQWALLELLRLARDRPEISVAIESLDDIEIQGSSDVRDLEQLKHSRRREAAA